MADSTEREGIVMWNPADYPHDPDGQQGMCHFSPNCGGVAYTVRGVEKMTKPAYPGNCPGAPAEFSERTGMLREGAGFERYVPLCRARAESRYGSHALRAAEAEGAVGAL